MASIMRFFKRPSGIATAVCLYTAAIIGIFEVIDWSCKSSVASVDAICVTKKKVVVIADSCAAEKIRPVRHKVDASHDDIIRVKAILEYMANPNTVAAANTRANRTIDSIKTIEEYNQ